MILGLFDSFGEFLFTVRLFLRNLISTIDGLLYTADAEFYDLMVKIANTEIFKDSTISAIAGRIYQLLALIMMFRLIFVSITYIMNPEMMLDKAKGYGNIVKKIIISLGLIIIVPWGFAQSRNLQAVIFDDNVIEYFIFGANDNSGVTPGYTFMYTIAKIFVAPYECIDNDCKPADIGSFTAKPEADIKVPCSADWNLQVPSIKSWGAVSDGDHTGKCGYGLKNDSIEIGKKAKTYDLDFGRTLRNASTPKGSKYDLISVMQLARYGDIHNSDKAAELGYNGDVYALYRLPVIGSTLIGLFIGYMLIVMCIDVAVRTVKLAFYEIISPVPIISYIGPKDGKDTMLSKWFNQTLKTYGSVFIRVAGLQLACLFITEIMKSGIVADDNIFVLLFLLIGVLTFAKQAPQIVKDLGINFEGGGFNLKKKLGDDTIGGLGGRMLSAPLGFAAGSAANALYNANARHRLRQEAKKMVKENPGMSRSEARQQLLDENPDLRKRSVLGGGISAGFRSAGSKESKSGNIFAGARAGVKGSVDKADTRDKQQKVGYNFVERAADRALGFAGAETNAQREIKKLKAQEIEEDRIQGQAIANANAIRADLRQKGFKADEIDEALAHPPTADQVKEKVKEKREEALASSHTTMNSMIDSMGLSRSDAATFKDDAESAVNSGDMGQVESLIGRYAEKKIGHALSDEQRSAIRTGQIDSLLAPLRQEIEQENANINAARQYFRGKGKTDADIDAMLSGTMPAPTDRYGQAQLGKLRGAMQTRDAKQSELRSNETIFQEASTIYHGVETATQNAKAVGEQYTGFIESITEMRGYNAQADASKAKIEKMHKQERIFETQDKGKKG